MNGNAGNNIFREKLQLRAAACSPVQLRQAGGGFLAEGLVMFSLRNDPKGVNSFCENFFPKAGEGMRRAAKTAT